MSVDSERKTEILDAAATLFASSGLRASLQQIADACGILAGSLYHHFESKEDIFIALVERYQAELDKIAEKTLAPGMRSRAPDERIVALGTAIAECAVRHRAALLLTLYEPPAGASKKMLRLASQTPTAINAAMLAILNAARSSGYLRREVDLDLLADRICQSMLHIGIGVSHRIRGGERMPVIKCRMLLHGLAVDLSTTLAWIVPRLAERRTKPSSRGTKTTPAWTTRRPGSERPRDRSSLAAATN